MEANSVSEAQRLPVDIITTLPQTIIETILCFLPIEEAARTSILSREWRYKLTKIPKVEFHESSIKRKIIKVNQQPSDIASAMQNMSMRHKIFYAIYQILLTRQAPIQEFILVMDASQEYFEIDQIILNLSSNQTIKKLTLRFWDEDAAFKLPLSFYSMQHLTYLCLDACYIDHKRIFSGLFSGFGSLTSLTLNRVTISQEALLHFLYKCPSLKSLSLGMYEENLEGYKDFNTTELFKCLPVIEHLTTYGYFIRCIDVPAVSEELSTSLNHLRYFCVKEIIFGEFDELAFILVLMKCSPNLEKIKLEICSDDDYYIDDDETFSGIWKRYSDVCFERLNELRIKGFKSKRQELEFVKFVLARSPNLKKLMLI